MQNPRSETAEKALRKFLEKTKQREAVEGISEKLLGSLFNKQREFVEHPSKEKAAVCGRRAGKSRGTVTGMLARAYKKPGTSYIYGGLTRKSAKRIGFKTLLRLDKQYGLGIQFNHTDLTAELPNGSEFLFLGLDDTEAAEAARGTVEKVEIVALDECASYGPNFQYVVEEVLEPMLLDADGELWWIGSPGAACQGPFFDVTNGTTERAAAPTFHWSVLDNPHIPHAAEWLRKKRKKKGWSDDNPIYRREYLGEWVHDDSSLVYRFMRTRNVAALPKGTWHTILGVDLGYDDATAIVCIAYSLESPSLYVIDEFKKTKMLPSDVAEKIREFQMRHNPSATVVDTGGLGKAIVEEMKVRYSLNLKPAEKNKKYEYVELANSDFFEGRIKLVPELKLLPSELSLLQWDEDRRHEDDRFENHCTDAFLYAWRESFHWGYRKPEPKIREYSDAWAAEHERKLAQQLQEQDKKNWWEKLFE